MPATYIDAITYKNAATGLVLANYYGNLAHISACSVGAVSLTVPGLATALNQYDALYLFDGANSEVLQVGSGGAAQNATTIPLQAATTFAHAGGTVYCTDGTQGSLGQAIFEASKWLEDICYQSLWQATYTGEALPLPTPRANIDNRGGLNFRPLHFPISAVTAMSIATGDSTSVITYDTAQVQLDSLGRIVTVPLLKPLNSGQQSLTSQFWPSVSRSQKAMLSVTYTAGFTAGQMPWAVTRAATMLANEMLGLAENPIGADTIMQGKRNVTFTMRGDLTGESLLVKRARMMLDRYTAKSY